MHRGDDVFNDRPITTIIVVFVYYLYTWRSCRWYGSLPHACIETENSTGRFRLSDVRVTILLKNAYNNVDTIPIEENITS
jgi:hypothetical protein